MKILGIVLMIVAVIGFFLWLSRNKNETSSSTMFDMSKPDFQIDATPDSPLSFGYKISWLAIRTSDMEQVAEKLELEDTREANWQTGLQTAYETYDGTVFVTPPIKEWVFVVGIMLPDAGDSNNPDKASPFLTHVGTTYDSLYYFATHRVVEYHAWAKVENGEIVRAYAYSGEQGKTFWNKGEKTEIEQQLKFNFFADEPPSGEGDKYWEREDLRFPNEEDVLRISGAWCLNPIEIENMNLESSTGIIGKVPEKWK